MTLLDIKKLQSQGRESLHKFSYKFSTVRTDFRLTFFGILVGIVGGLSAIIFRILIEIVALFLLNIPKNDFSLEENIIIVLAPCLGGLIVGYITLNISSEAKGHGIPEIIDAIYNNKGIMRFRVPVAKMIASSLTIGTGGAAGREGPIAQISGGFGSLIAQKFNLTPEERKDLILSGVAAGISATFYAPIGAILFALEVVKRDNRATPLVPLVVSSVVGTAIAGIYYKIVGQTPSFIFPVLSYSHAENIPIFIILGLFIGFFAFLWVKGFYIIENIFDKIKVSQVLVTGFGGLLIGFLILFFNKIKGLNYTTINEAFAGSITFENAVILFIIAFLTISITLGSGGSGGIFAPTLFLGVMLGIIFGHLFPVELDIALFAVLGMASMFGGAARAPLTAIIMTAEMVEDFLIIIPLMFAVTASWFVSSLLLGTDDIFILKLKNRNLTFEAEGDLLETFTVNDIMITDVITVSTKDRIEHVMKLMEDTGHTGFPVKDNGTLIGIITEHDIDHALRSKNLKNYTVGDIATKNVVSVAPDCPLTLIMSLIQKRKINRFPVVDSNNSRTLVGWVTRSDLVKAYMKARHSDIVRQHEDKLFESKFILNFDEDQKSKKENKS